MALNVETYQHSKKNSGGGNGNGSSQEILDRLDKLENSQNHLFNEFHENFDRTSYIDEYRTTAIVTTDGVIARQFRKNLKETLDNDLMVDWTNTIDLIIEQGYAKIAYNNLNSATLVTKYFDTPNMKGFRFDFVEKHFRVPSAGKPTEITPEANIWFTSGVDNAGRVWVIDSRCDVLLNANKFYVTIYDKDMAVLIPRKELSYDFSDIAKANSLYLTLNGEITFDEVNNAIFSFAATYAGRTTPIGVYDTNSNYIQMALMSVDRNGDNPKNMAQRVFSTSSNSSYFRGLNIPFMYKPELVGGKLIFQWIRNSYHYVYYANGHNVEWDYANIYSYNIESRELTELKGIGGTERFTRYDNGSNWKLMAICPSVFINDERNGMLKEFTLGDYYSNSPIGFFLREYNYKSSANEVNEVKLLAYNHADILNKTTNGYFGGRVNGMYYSKEKSKMYFFRPDTAADTHTKFTIFVFGLDIVTGAMTFETSSVIDMKTNATSLYYSLINSNLKVIEVQGDLHLLFLGKDPNTLSNSLKYMCIGSDLQIKIAPTLVHCSNKVNGDVYSYNLHHTGSKLIFIYNETGEVNAKVGACVRKATLELENTSISYEYFNELDAKWYAITPNQNIELVNPLNRVKLKANLNSPTGVASPELHQINLQYWSNENESVTKSEFHSKRIPGIENSGRAVLTTNHLVNDGVIRYFVSYDAGNTFVEIIPGQEFNYNVIETPDFRVKIELYVKNGSDLPPKVIDYTITSNHVVMHSDLERVQINLIKTNFKIDTLTKASTNGLNKMVIDTFNDVSLINPDKSDFIHTAATGEVSGNYIQTNPIKTNGIIKYILLTSDEVLSADNPNCKVEYFVSADKGTTFTTVTEGVKTKINTQNATDDFIEIRAVMYEGAKISAIGWAWD